MIRDIPDVPGLRGARSSGIPDPTHSPTRAPGAGSPADAATPADGPPGGTHPRPGLPHRVRRRLRGPVRRSHDSRVVAGVCGGLAAATGIDATLLRIGVVLLTLGSGVGILAYALAWLLVPLDGEPVSIFTRSLTDRRGIRILVAVVPVLVALQVVAAGLHLGYLGSFGWPVFLAGGVAVLIHRNASVDEQAWITGDLLPMVRTGQHGGGRRRSVVVRIASGVVVGVAGLVLLLGGHPTSATLLPLTGALLLAAALVVVFGPWWLRLVRDLMTERQGRALAEERAQMAAHVHDSVLQTLALVQRSADDPRQVVRLARAQERELRAWLYEGRPPGTIGDEAASLADGIAALQRQVEADHGVAVQVVVVGDCPLDDRLRSVLDAAREAAVNAAKWSGEGEVSVYAEVEPQSVTVCVRDRGCGFDPSDLPGDRKGIAESIRARMSRLEGTATVRSSPGAGTEVVLTLPRGPAAP